MSYRSSIIREIEENSFFRKVVFTGQKTQLVVMTIPPGGEIGEETHTYVEQTFFFHEGTGTVQLDGETYPVVAGDVVVITPGTKHNFINTGSSPVKLYTVYAPPNHLDGTVHHTKEDADADTRDEAFGHDVQ